jgi:phage terminase large subunit
MMYGGIWDRMSGLVYDCLDPDVHVVDPFPLPPGTLYAGGIDWGFTEPFVLTIRAITPQNEHYQLSETYKTGMTVSQIVQLLQQKNSIYRLDAVFCGPDRPENISELCRHGIKALPADNDVRLGIDRHYELIRSGKFRIFRGTSPKSLDEYATYHYPEPEDLKPDQNAKEQKPVAQDDHAMDSSRYLSIMTYDGLQKVAPHVPAEHTQEQISQAKRLEMLKRRTREYDAVNW